MQHAAPAMLEAAEGRDGERTLLVLLLLARYFVFSFTGSFAWFPRA